jgi:predicted ATPase with chaperone activity
MGPVPPLLPRSVTIPSTEGDLDPEVEQLLHEQLGHREVSRDAHPLRLEEDGQDSDKIALGDMEADLLDPAHLLLSLGHRLPPSDHDRHQPAGQCRIPQKRISGPLLDRIDIHLDVPRIPHEQLSDRRPGELSAAIQERVARARDIQATRFTGTALLTNADMGPKELRQHAALDDATETLLGAAVRQMGLSARAYHRVLKLARTIADLAAEECITTAHVAEALQYRPRVAEG